MIRAPLGPVDGDGDGDGVDVDGVGDVVDDVDEDNDENLKQASAARQSYVLLKTTKYHMRRR